MLSLDRKSLNNKELWKNKGISLFAFDDEKMMAKTKRNPSWIHFGTGNIFRSFIAPLQQDLLEKGLAETGIIAVAPYNGEMINKIYRPHDNLVLLVTMHADNRMEKKVIGSISESLTCSPDYKVDWLRLQEIMRQPSLQVISFTITEKGYKIKDLDDVYIKDVAEDIKQGIEAPQSFIGKITALAYQRYLAGAYPVAFLSLDNCSHNGEKLQASVVDLAQQWVDNGFAKTDFISYLNNREQVAFPCSMIDKITPRPAKIVQTVLRVMGLQNMNFVRSSRNSYYAPFVNAEKTEYLVIEDDFPNGRMPLEKAGAIFTTREIVDKVERMKVCTCLNPLHTALAVFGCLLGYTLIAAEMKNPLLKKLVENIGYQEGLPVVTDPGVLNPQEFLKEVLEERFPNPNIPDTPQRIASDTSQKMGIRFGETIKAYVKNPELKVKNLVYIPLVIAGWCRYLLGIDDEGETFELSPDPLIVQLRNQLQGIYLGMQDPIGDQLRGILSNDKIFGVDLYEIGLGRKIEGYFQELIVAPGSIKKTLHKYLD